MMTGEQYKTSLNDGRATYFEGRKVDDLPPPHPRPVRRRGGGQLRPGVPPSMSATNPLMAVPRPRRSCAR